MGLSWRPKEFEDGGVDVTEALAEHRRSRRARAGLERPVEDLWRCARAASAWCCGGRERETPANDARSSAAVPSRTGDRRFVADEWDAAKSSWQGRGGARARRRAVQERRPAAVEADGLGSPSTACGARPRSRLRHSRAAAQRASRTWTVNLCCGAGGAHVRRRRPPRCARWTALLHAKVDAAAVVAGRRHALAPEADQRSRVPQDAADPPRVRLLFGVGSERKRVARWWTAGRPSSVVCAAFLALLNVAPRRVGAAAVAGASSVRGDERRGARARDCPETRPPASGASSLCRAKGSGNGACLHHTGTSALAPIAYAARLAHLMSFRLARRRRAPLSAGRTCRCGLHYRSRRTPPRRR